MDQKTKKSLSAAIERALKALYKLYEKSYADSFPRFLTYDVEYHQEFIDVSCKHNIEPLGSGVDRVAFSIVHKRKTYVFKIAYSHSNPNDTELAYYHKYGRSKYARSVMLPILHTFCSEWTRSTVIIMPLAKTEDGIFRHSSFIAANSNGSELDRFNRVRAEFLEEWIMDAGGDNLGMWNGYIWVLDWVFMEPGYAKSKRKFENRIRRNSGFQKHFDKTLKLVG